MNDDWCLVANLGHLSSSLLNTVYFVALFWASHFHDKTNVLFLVLPAKETLAFFY